MRTGWGLLACGVVVGAAAGFVCGHVAAWTHASVRPPERTSFAAVPPLGGFELLVPVDEDAEPEGAVFFPQHLHPPAEGHQPVHADAELAAGDVSGHEVSGHEPGELPEPAEATPLSDDDDRTLRAILESELAHLSPADRDVWLDVLEGLPPADAVGIVRLWKRFGSGPGLADESHHANALPESIAPSILLPTPNSPAPFNADSLVPRTSRTNLREARELVMHNLLSAETFGFRRFEPCFGTPAQASSPANVEANRADGASGRRGILQMIGARIDHSPGEFMETASPLDFAIEGDGFFVVTDPEYGESFTRCGRFSRDDDGRLSLLTSRGLLMVSPEIIIPNDCTAVTVALDGEVSIRRESGTPETIGVLALALFVAPAQLDARSDALFAATEQSGSPQLGRPHDGLRGGILQNRLERSNVNVVQESALLQQIDDWLETIADSTTAR